MMPARHDLRLPPFLVLALAACATAVRGGGPESGSPTPSVAAAPAAPAPAAAPSDAEAAPPKPRSPVAPPATAMMLGLMPLEATGVAAWHAAHPSWDGRGVLIGILDSGVDPGVAGLVETTTGQPKILDLRNFSGEGDVALVPVRADSRGLIEVPGGPALEGAEAVRAVASDSAWYGGVVRELPFGDAPAADFNGNGTNRDSYGVVVVRTASGWVAFIDTNGNGSLADETPLADFLVQRQTFTFASRFVARGRGPITGAVNLSAGPDGKPRLSLLLDTAGHGTHVAGIAAGHDIYGVRGFDGVAPGAQLVALKIANDARGGLSTTGSMIRAMEYAARFAAERRLPLVLNMSFGIGNMEPGAAVMDSLVDAFLAAHPGVVFSISAGNEGPGMETVGLPGSADLALTAGAAYPGAFAPLQFGSASPDVMGWWSSRGGETDKPDVVTPGIAYSTVPAWNTGEEVKGGTSMAAPHAAGLAALLVSALRAGGRQATAAQIVAALRVTARHLTGETEADEGWGLPRIEAAWRWLEAGHAAGAFEVRALPPAPRGATDGRGPRVAVVEPTDRPSAAYRRYGLLGAGDTIQAFRVTRVGPGGAATYRLTSNRTWLAPVRPTVTLGADGSAVVEVRYDPARHTEPGRHVGAVEAVNAADTSAGPAFRLLSEVLVPEAGGGTSFDVQGRTLPPGRAARYYVDVPGGASGLAVRLTLPDTGARGSLTLYEPSGRQSRTRDEAAVGGGNGAVGELSVAAEDLEPGVWEAVVQAMPGDTLRYALAARVPRVSVARVDSGTAPSVTLLSSAGADTTVRVRAEQLGVVTAWDAVVEKGAPYTRTFAAPEWATDVVVEVRLTPAEWNAVTDFGITVFDRDGAQLGQGPMNYDFNRVSVDLPAKRGPDFPVTVELFPAFALPQPPDRFTAAVRLAFVGAPRAIPLGGADTVAAVTIPARGSLGVAIPPFARLSSGDWRDLVRVTVSGGKDDWVDIVRSFGVSRP